MIKGQQGAVQVAELLKPRVMLPTAAGGDLTYSGLLLKFLKDEGNVDSLRSLLAAHNLKTQVMDIKPWERIEININQATY